MSNATSIKTSLALVGATLAFALVAAPAANARSMHSRPHVQDHRPGTPIVNHRGNHIGTLPQGGTRNDLGWSGNHPRGSGYQNPYTSNGGAGVTSTNGSRPRVQDHRGIAGSGVRGHGGRFYPSR